MLGVCDVNGPPSTKYLPATGLSQAAQLLARINVRKAKANRPHPPSRIFALQRIVARPAIARPTPNWSTWKNWANEALKRLAEDDG
jgi:hypothetical protein